MQVDAMLLTPARMEKTEGEGAASPGLEQPSSREGGQGGAGVGAKRSRLQDVGSRGLLLVPSRLQGDCACDLMLQSISCTFRSC